MNARWFARVPGLCDHHLCVDLDLPLPPAWRRCADVLHLARRCGSAAAGRLARAVLREYPGCALVLVGHSAGAVAATGSWSAGLRPCGRAEFSRTDRRLLGSALYGWRAAGRELGAVREIRLSGHPASSAILLVSRSVSGALAAR